MRLALACLAVLLTPLASAQSARTATFDGQLDALDDTLTTGEALDRYLFDVAAGETVTVELVSDAFDTWLVLKQPAGANLDNDDWNGSRRVSRIVALADSAGTFEALATTFAPGMGGAYRLTVSTTPSTDAPASPTDAAGLVGTVWAEDCSGAAASRTYLALGAGGALSASGLSPDAVARVEGARWQVEAGALLVTRGAAVSRYPLMGGGVLAGTSPDVCGDAARLMRLP